MGGSVRQYGLSLNEEIGQPIKETIEETGPLKFQGISSFATLKKAIPFLIRWLAVAQH